MSRFELSRQAVSDLNAIADYTVERWGKAQARVYVEAMQGRLTELAHQPSLGRKRDELSDGLLSFPFESHVIFYQRAPFGIMVVRILHKRQDAPLHFD
ncbi:MAG: type II toxin-antitoxin system RelE/ParE family toxin [Rhodospirillales bacterium]|nr:type II toxin-antitoxin system RelE/ParE family toxin [Rhodospirillales bacterium]